MSASPTQKILQDKIRRYATVKRRNDSLPDDIECARLDMVAARLDGHIELALLEGLDNDRRLKCAAVLIGTNR